MSITSYDNFWLSSFIIYFCSSFRYAFKAYIGTHCLLSTIHMVRLLSGYLLMMCIMSFNIWMLVSTVVGGGIGYLCSRPIINHCLFKYRNNYNITRHPHTQLKPARQGNSQDYLPLGLYFNTSDPWSNSTDKQDSVCEQELIMYVSVLWKLVIVFFFFISFGIVSRLYLFCPVVFSYMKIK